jgi:hypothetical protein
MILVFLVCAIISSAVMIHHPLPGKRHMKKRVLIPIKSGRPSFCLRRFGLCPIADADESCYSTVGPQPMSDGSSAMKA